MLTNLWTTFWTRRSWRVSAVMLMLLLMFALALPSNMADASPTAPAERPEQVNAYSTKQVCGGFHIVSSVITLMKNVGCIKYNGKKAWVAWQDCNSAGLAHVSNKEEVAYVWWERGAFRLDVGCNWTKTYSFLGVSISNDCWMRTTYTVHGIGYNRRSNWC